MSKVDAYLKIQVQVQIEPIFTSRNRTTEEYVMRIVNLKMKVSVKQNLMSLRL